MTKKIFHSILLVAGAVLLASLLFIMGCLYEYFGSVEKKQLRDELELASVAVERGGEDYLSSISSERYRLTWIAPDGTVLYDTVTDAESLENHADREEVREALAGGEGESSRYSSTILQKTMYCARRLTDGSVLRISISRATAGVLLIGMVQPILIVVIVLLAVFGPGMNSYTYSGQELSQKNFAPRVPGIESFGILDGSEKMSTTTGTKIINNYVEKGKDDVYYWFGSDLYGRDIWTRTWEGARVSLIIAVAAAIIDMVIGMSYGLISGYFGGKVDLLMQRFLEVANGIPRLVIVTLLLLILQPGMITIIFALMLTEWVGMSRIARAEMLKLKDQEFVLASRTLGAGSFFIIFKEVLPNIIGPIITQVMFSIPTAIFTEAFLSFVGLGIPVPQCSLGSLISELYNSFTTHPYQIIPPIVVMSLLMLSFNLVADGLREALDPKMKSM
mgnify:CR=1 FL=1